MQMTNDEKFVMTNVQPPMTKRVPMVQGSKKKIFDLGERTEKFGEAILDFAKTLPVTPVTEPLIGQLVRSGTSVGANYCEADDASTKKEFIYKVAICQREVKETKFWLKMVSKALPNTNTASLLNEAQELRLIFSSILNKCRK